MERQRHVVVPLQPHPAARRRRSRPRCSPTPPRRTASTTRARTASSGFAGQITDYLGQVNTDVFGNPLCTTYETDGDGQVILDGDLLPTVLQIGGKCLSDVDGVLTIPNLGPNRYALSMVPPTGSSWVQTTTLEGNHDWDAWVMEGATGLDTEFVVAGEPFPATIFGYVPGPIDSYWNSQRPQVRRPAGRARSRASWTRSTCTSRPTVASPCPEPSGAAWPAPRSIIRSTSRGSRCPTSDRGDTAVWVGRGNDDGAFRSQRPRRDLHADVLGRARRTTSSTSSR